MRLRTLSVAGLGTAALVLAAIPLGAATASGSHGSGVSLLASGASSHSARPTASKVPAGAGLCGTGFGPELPTPDGIISWNDTTGTGFDTAGAADFVCSAHTVIHKVAVLGYFGTAPTETFNVTVYGNDPTDGSNEPNDNAVICSYTNLVGKAGGQYPTHQLTKLSLGRGKTGCHVKKGEFWISVQNNDSAGPWYWEMQDVPQGGLAAPDWRDVNNVFGSNCTTYDTNGSGGDEYLVNCLGYTYADWMLKLT